jgi:hypothetical protein
MDSSSSIQYVLSFFFFFLLSFFFSFFSFFFFSPVRLPLLCTLLACARGAAPDIVADISGAMHNSGGHAQLPPLRLPANVAEVATTNPHNTERIFNWLVKFLDERHRQRYPDTLVVLRGGGAGDAAPAEREVRRPFVRDAFKVMADGAVLDRYEIRDTIFGTPFAREYDALIAQANAIIRAGNARRRVPAPELPGYEGLPHRDAFQLIPSWQVNFAGGVLSNVVISNNEITSPGYLQAIFASDGAFRNLRIVGNRIKTGSPHQITIAGMLSGEIRGNTDLDGHPLHSVTLLPLRLGGGHNVFVLSFHRHSGFAYAPVAGITAAQDQRRVVHSARKYGATYLVDFRMDLFAAEYHREFTRAGSLGGQERAALAARLAPKYGRVHRA